MSEELKNKLDSFIKYIIGKINQKDLVEIQQKYDEFIDFYKKFSILSNEDFESIEKIMNEYDDLQAKIKTYETQKEIDADKIKTMKAELNQNLELNNKYKKLNEDYNILKEKYNVYQNDNQDFQMKLKNNEKLINDLQTELNNVKKENFEKFEKISELEQKFKLYEGNLSVAKDQINKLSIENCEIKKIMRK